MRRILVTGADGFIARNLITRLGERDDCEVLRLTRESGEAALAEAARAAEFVYHLAGVNRPPSPDAFEAGNRGFTAQLCEALRAADNTAPIVFASSTQAALENPYGQSKRAAEDELFDHARRTGAAALVYRLPNVFGKWARPNYNSAIATFCHNVAQGKPVVVHDASAPLTLVYVDDVVDAFVAQLDAVCETGFCSVHPTYQTTVGEAAAIIGAFPESRETLLSPPVGEGLVRALYATYLTYLRPDDFTYTVPIHGKDDPRGVFVEMLKTRDSGQFSYFIARPGVTRGDHYHHSKTEKFLVISGTADFAFRDIASGATHNVTVHGGDGRIVETIPGWTHNITNIGDQDLICMLWANEIFDRDRPDTIGMKV